MESNSQMHMLNGHFTGNMAAQVKQINIDGTDYDEIVDF